MIKGKEEQLGSGRVSSASLNIVSMLSICDWMGGENKIRAFGTGAQSSKAVMNVTRPTLGTFVQPYASQAASRCLPYSCFVEV